MVALVRDCYTCCAVLTKSPLIEPLVSGRPERQSDCEAHGLSSGATAITDFGIRRCQREMDGETNACPERT